MHRKTRPTKNSLSLFLIFLVYFFVLVIWTVYRYVTHFPETSLIDNLVAKPLIWILPMILVLLWKKIPLQTFSFKRITVRLLILSILSGIALAFIQIIPNIIKGYAQIQVLSGFGQLLIATLGTAVYEELFFRGFLLKQLQNHFTAAIANGISSVLFMCIHIPILVFDNHLSGEALYIGMYVILATGIGLGLLFQYTKNLWASIIAHYVCDSILSIF